MIYHGNQDQIAWQSISSGHLARRRLEATMTGNGYINMCQSDGVVARPFPWRNGQEKTIGYWVWLATRSKLQGTGVLPWKWSWEEKLKIKNGRGLLAECSVWCQGNTRAKLVLFGRDLDDYEILGRLNWEGTNNLQLYLSHITHVLLNLVTVQN